VLDRELERLRHVVGVDVVQELGAKARNNDLLAGGEGVPDLWVKISNGPIGGQPGPLMWPGWSTVVTRPPDRVSAASSSAMAAFRVPYSPNGGGGRPPASAA